MDEVEARALLTDKIDELRQLSYIELAQRIPKTKRFLGIEFTTGDENLDIEECFGPSGSWYELEISVLWDGETERDIRVIVAIDDGGPSVHRPMTDDFIMAPDGTFVGE